MFLVSLIAGVGAAPAPRVPAVMPSPNPPAVFNLSIVRADKAAAVIHSLYPHAVIRIDQGANSVIVVAAPDDVAAIRSVISGIDVKDPTATEVDAIQLHSAKPDDVAMRMRAIFQKSRFVVAPNEIVVVAAVPRDMTQIKAIIAAIDTPPATPTPKPTFPTQTVRVLQGEPRNVARAIARSYPHLRVAVSGMDLLLNGTPDDVNQAKTIVSALDHPSAAFAFAKAYRVLRAVIEKGPAAVSESPPPQPGVLAPRVPFPPGGCGGGRRSFMR